MFYDFNLNTYLKAKRRFFLFLFFKSANYYIYKSLQHIIQFFKKTKPPCFRHTAQ